MRRLCSPNSSLTGFDSCSAKASRSWRTREDPRSPTDWAVVPPLVARAEFLTRCLQSAAKKSVSLWRSCSSGSFLRRERRVFVTAQNISFHVGLTVTGRSTGLTVVDKRIKASAADDIALCDAKIEELVSELYGLTLQERRTLGLEG